MINFELGSRLARAQARVFACIADELAKDDYHKSFEGAIDVTYSLPNYFSDDGPKWVIELHAYVLDGMEGRRKSWAAGTLADAVAIAEAGIEEICRPYEFERFARRMNDAESDDGPLDGTR